MFQYFNSVSRSEAHKYSVEWGEMECLQYKRAAEASTGIQWQYWDITDLEHFEHIVEFIQLVSSVANKSLYTNHIQIMSQYKAVSTESPQLCDLPTSLCC